MPEAVAKLGNPKWVKGGASPNPGGRPRAVLDVTQLARSYTTEAVETLVRALGDPRHRVAAACALLDRGWGKPEQRIHAQSEQTVLHLIAAQMTAVADTSSLPTINVRAEDTLEGTAVPAE